MRRRRRVVVDQRGRMRAAAHAMVAAHGKLLRGDAPADIADHARRDDDGRERRVECEDRDERRSRDGPERRPFQRARPDPPRGVQHDRDDRRLDAVEDSGDRGNVAVGHVQPRQRDEHDERGQHEQRARDDAAPRPVHEPSDVGRELLRLGAGQDHAVVERVQEALLRDPALRIDEIVMHDRDLAGGSAETDEAELQPVAKRLGAGRRRGRRGRRAHAPSASVPMLLRWRVGRAQSRGDAPSHTGCPIALGRRRVLADAFGPGLRPARTGVPSGLGFARRAHAPSSFCVTGYQLHFPGADSRHHS